MNADEVMTRAVEYAIDYEKHEHAAFGNRTLAQKELAASRRILESAIRDLCAENERLKAELAESEDANEALDCKLQSLGFHASETCGCSYDKKEHVCMHHSPQLTAATQEVERLKAELAEVKRMNNLLRSEVERLNAESTSF